MVCVTTEEKSQFCIWFAKIFRFISIKVFMLSTNGMELKTSIRNIEHIFTGKKSSEHFMKNSTHIITNDEENPKNIFENVCYAHHSSYLPSWYGAFIRNVMSVCNVHGLFSKWCKSDEQNAKMMGKNVKLRSDWKEAPSCSFICINRTAYKSIHYRVYIDYNHRICT